jgi:hypothetical protein
MPTPQTGPAEKEVAAVLELTLAFNIIGLFAAFPVIGQHAFA